MKIKRIVHVEDMEDIAIGGAVLGTGGGGDPYVGKLMAQEAIRRHAPVKIIDVDALADDALVVPVCMMGAPTVMTEKIPAGHELIVARKLEELLGRRIDAVLCGEAGGVNSTIPSSWPPKPDCHWWMATAWGAPFRNSRWKPSACMASRRRRWCSATTRATRWYWIRFPMPGPSDWARAATVEMGGSALLAFYSMDGATAKKCGTRHAQPDRQAGESAARSQGWPSRPRRRDCRRA